MDSGRCEEVQELTSTTAQLQDRSCALEKRDVAFEPVPQLVRRSAESLFERNVVRRFEPVGAVSFGRAVIRRTGELSKLGPRDRERGVDSRRALAQAVEPEADDLEPLVHRFEEEIGSSVADGCVEAVLGVGQPVDTLGEADERRGELGLARRGMVRRFREAVQELDELRLKRARLGELRLERRELRRHRPLHHPTHEPLETAGWRNARLGRLCRRRSIELAKQRLERWVLIVGRA